MGREFGHIFEAAPSAFWAQEKARREASNREWVLSVHEGRPDPMPWWRVMRETCGGSPHFRNYTRFIQSGRAAPIT